MTQIDLENLEITTEGGKTFIALPNGEFVELKLAGSTLYLDHKLSLDGGKLAELPIAVRNK